MKNICTPSAIVLLQYIMPLVSSKDIRPGTQLPQYYQSWRLGHEIKHGSPAEYCRPQKEFQWVHLYFFTQRRGRSSTISQLYGGWFSQERRPEIKFLYQGLKHIAQPEDRMPISMQMLRHLGCSIMQGFPNVNSVEPPMAQKKQRKTVTSQTRLMITTNWQFSWKHNAVKYL